MSAVRLHCQTIALYMGFPVFLSHSTVVSRWLVMPIPAIYSAETPDCATASIITPYCEDHISIGSCSTQPS